MHANWTSYEEDMLKRLVDKTGEMPINWISIAEALNKKILNKTRTGKQCREKYINRIKYNPKSSLPVEWTPEELTRLFEKYDELGSRWTLIQNYFPNRAENTLKNKFYGQLRKAIRKINSIGKKHIKGFSKDIKYESIMRIKQGSEGILDFKGQLKSECEKLKKKILCVLMEKLDDSEILALINQIHAFNMATRCYCAKKAKKKVTTPKTCIKREESIVKEEYFQQQLSGEQGQGNGVSTSHDGQLNECPEPNNFTLEKLEPLDLPEYRKNENQKRIFSEKCLSDLDEEVSNILGHAYTPIGFSYFEEN